jgi:hypothetical protein
MPLALLTSPSVQADPSSGNAASGDSAAAGTGGGRSGNTSVIEHIFDTPDGTPQDDSLSLAEAAELKAVQAEEARKASEAAEGDKVNTTPGEKYHVICSLGAGVYVQWQSRVVSGWISLCVGSLGRQGCGRLLCCLFAVLHYLQMHCRQRADRAVPALCLLSTPQSYYWYKKTKEQCEAAGDCPMGGYTRLLHRSVVGLALLRLLVL